MQTSRPERKSLVASVVLVVTLATLGFTCAIKLAQSAAEFGPQVGDVLSFEPMHRISQDPPPRVTVTRDGQGECVLDFAVIRRSGGSLVIESLTPRPGRVYGAHWAGPRSSADGGDCGQSAALTLTDDNLEVLALAAGGYGVADKRLIARNMWSSDTTPHQ